MRRIRAAATRCCSPPGAARRRAAAFRVKQHGAQRVVRQVGLLRHEKRLPGSQGKAPAERGPEPGQSPQQRRLPRAARAGEHPPGALRDAHRDRTRKHAALRGLEHQVPDFKRVAGGGASGARAGSGGSGGSAAQAAPQSGPETLVYGESKDPFLAAVRSSLRYPPRAAENGWQGVALMEFSVSADGRIQSLRVYESSGRAILDRAAQSAVEKAASQ
ncbi:MAG: energy transducer TonB [Mesosutterella sp.]|nr:energy transducer TonB [Mesosutterella sp.]